MNKLIYYIGGGILLILLGITIGVCRPTAKEKGEPVIIYNTPTTDSLFWALNKSMDSLKTANEILSTKLKAKNNELRKSYKSIRELPVIVNDDSLLQSIFALTSDSTGLLDIRYEEWRDSIRSFQIPRPNYGTQRAPTPRDGVSVRKLPRIHQGTSQD